MYDVTYPLFPIFAFLGFVLSLIPLPWHLQAWNSGTCYFMIWTSLACLNQFVNSIIWAGNALNPAPWWCEISIRIIMGASVGIPASSLCIVRRLYLIARVQAVTVTRAEKRRAVLIDSLICVLFPVIYIALQYVVQGHRFNIFEDIGCFPALYNTLLTYFISFMWPMAIGLISAVYCALALREFNRRRIQFSQLMNSNTSLTMSRYFRLMALAMTEMLCTTPLAIFVIYLNATSSVIGPWRSWADTHFVFSRIEQIPSVLWRSNHLLVVSMELTRWVAPFCAIVFFGFFGFAQEAKKNYRVVYHGIAKRVGVVPLPSSFLSSKGAPRRPNIIHNISIPSSGGLPDYTPSSAKSFDKSTYALSLRDSMFSGDTKTTFDIKHPLTPTTPHDSVALTDANSVKDLSNDDVESWQLSPITAESVVTFNDSPS